MNEDKDDKSSKNFQTYSLLQMKMKEVEKKKKVTPAEKSSNRPKEKVSEPPKIKEEKSSISKQSIPPVEIVEEETDPNAPDRTYGDLYCKICDSHMNSEAMWGAHVTGKKHIKNVKKGVNESKYEDLPHEESNVKYELRNVKDPIIGLNYIEELRKFDPAFPPFYNCYLCHSNLATLPLLIEHIISAKHQLNFMRENKPKEYQLIQAAGLKKGQLEPLVTEKAALLEEEYGRGNVIVRREKPKTGTNGRKRGYDSDDDDKYANFSKKQNNKAKSENSKGKWGGLDTHKSDYPTFDSKENIAKRSFYQHNDHSRQSNSFRGPVGHDLDNDSRSSNRSTDRDREEHFRRLLSDDYPKRSSDYARALNDYPRRFHADDYLKSTDSPKEYDRQHDRYAASTSARADNLYSNSSHYDNARDSRSSYHQDKTHSSAASQSVASREERSNNSPAKNPLKDFLNQLFNVSQEYFLRITLKKFKDALASKHSFGRAELDILAQINDVTKKLIYENLSSGLEAFFKEGNSQNNPVASSTTAQSPEFSISDITELLMKARKASETVTNPQTQQTFIQNNPTLPGNNMAGNFPPPGDFLGPRDMLNTTFIKQADNIDSKFGLGGNFSGPPKSVAPDNFGPGGNFPRLPSSSAASNFRKAGNFSGPRNNVSTDSMMQASNFSSGSGNFGQAGNFPPVSNMAPGNFRQADNFPPVNNTAPGNFRSNNFQSLQTSSISASGYSPFNNQSSANNIPGLTLAESNSPPKIPYNTNFRRY